MGTVDSPLLSYLEKNTVFLSVCKKHCFTFQRICGAEKQTNNKTRWSKDPQFISFQRPAFLKVAGKAAGLQPALTCSSGDDNRRDKGRQEKIYHCIQRVHVWTHRKQNRAVRAQSTLRGAASKVSRGSDWLDLSHGGAHSLGTETAKSCYRDMNPDCSQSAVFSSPATSRGFACQNGNLLHFFDFFFSMIMIYYFTHVRPTFSR